MLTAAPRSSAIRPRTSPGATAAPLPSARRTRRARVVSVRASDETGLAAAFAHAPKEAWIALGSRECGEGRRGVEWGEREPSQIDTTPLSHQPPLLPSNPPVVAGLSAVVASALTGGDGSPSSSPSSAGATQAAPTRPAVKNAVLVFGASGKTGRAVVASLLASGRDVVAAVRDEARAKDALATVGVAAEGVQPGGGGTLAIVSGVDVTTPSTLDPASNPSLWAGVTQAVLALGPVVGRAPEGGCPPWGAAYLDGASPEAIDAKGVEAVATAIAAALPGPSMDTILAPPTPVVLPMASGKDLDTWERLDDVIMGGVSESVLEPSGPEGGDSSGAVWRGVLRFEGESVWEEGSFFEPLDHSHPKAYTQSFFLTPLQAAASAAPAPAPASPLI